jgi:FlaG/FlaF family flagellin (archaellin)
MTISSRFAALAACIACAACSKTQGAPSPPTSASATPSAGSAQETDYTLATSSGDCVAGSPCSLTLRLAATSGYHINDQYPYKYTAITVPAVDFQGTDPQGKNVFSKSAGDFATQGPGVGVMTVKFTPKSRGNITIDGTFKLSVCSEANCKIDSATPSVTVAVK